MIESSRLLQENNLRQTNSDRKNNLSSCNFNRKNNLPINVFCGSDGDPNPQVLGILTMVILIWSWGTHTSLSTISPLKLMGLLLSLP